MSLKQRLRESNEDWRLLREELDLLIMEDEEEEGTDADEEEANDGGEASGTGEEYEEQTDALYRRVQGLLNNDIFNHAAIVERLWGKRDASARSKFKKKLHREETEDGEYEYSFTRQELSDILAILGRAGSEAVSAFEKGRKKKQTSSSER